MEHDEAIRSQAAERYVARELSAAGREAFEEHFLGCRECADDVHFELAFAANVRAVLREQQVERQPTLEPLKKGAWESWRKWLRPRHAMTFSFAANFALAAGLGYVLVTGAHPVAQPRFAAVYFAPGPTHGAGDVHALPRGETSYGVRFPVPGAANQSFSYEVLSAAGRRESSRSLQAAASQDSFLYLYVPVDGLPGGVHTLVVRGPGGEIVSWSKFTTSG
jgi:hypothetical protein